MARPISERTRLISEYLVDSVRAGKKDVVADACAIFGISRQAMVRHIKGLIDAGRLTATGSTRARVYSLGPNREHSVSYALAELDEFRIFRTDFGFVFEGLPISVFDICEYGFTEMLNNAKDHSEGTEVRVQAIREKAGLRILISDNGEGIFRRIARLTGLQDPRESVLELSKGKMTTDPNNHSGESIFFSSRAFDYYLIISGDLEFAHHHKDLPDDDFLFHNDHENEGTVVEMLILMDSKKDLGEIYDEYTDANHGFDRTVVPLKLVLMEGEGNLVSRSQAKRILMSIEKFKRVVLDFKGVGSMRQGFADQVFRVFAEQHPDITLSTLNTTEEIDKMISRGYATQR